MLIKGYDAPLVAGEPLLARRGFWSNHLLAMCGEATSAGRPAPEWFGDDGADTDAMSETLFDPGRWPVFRIPAAEGPGAVVIYRNLVGDHGIDYLLTHPGRSGAQRIGSWEGELPGAGLTWQDLVRMAGSPSPGAEGVEDVTARLLLALPLLDDLELPETAPTRLGAALVTAGAPQDTASHTAERLLAHLSGRPRHESAWGSPLSGS
ncbi:hypothetical protein C5F59_024215 [Streptomyces sp. QL37]|uniref:hypothetical protein n=1 Tax=Streptomyces sp. QL37 TaxID=2093747 RepID=UPI000CF212C7|nr:hypothetical protein [Streptomyces sp. QL37]PPQ57712.1 hypothetical protein C5F59_14200 [Streptomyces sp. QL37]